MPNAPFQPCELFNFFIFLINRFQRAEGKTFLSLVLRSKNDRRTEFWKDKDVVAVEEQKPFEDSSEVAE
jgi:hypothetical protein